MKIFSGAVFLLVLAGCGGEAAAPTPSPSAEVAAPAPAPAQATWNLENPDGMTNGNLQLATSMYMRGDEIPQAEASIAVVKKAPWNFYGKRLCFPAVTARVDEMPPGSDLAKAMNGAGEIVAVTDDEHIIDMIVVGGTGDIEAGRRLNMCGLVVGKTEVPNAVGGTFTHLMMVGKLL